MKEVYIHRIFSTPIIHFSFSKHESYYFHDIEKTVRKPEGWSEQLNTSFPHVDKTDPFISQDKTYRLKNDLLESISLALRSVDLPYNVNFANFWYNIYHDNQGQEKHWHMPIVGTILPYWSGVYYNKNSSPTVFYRDYGMHRTHEFSGHETSHIKDCKWEYYSVNVKDGDVILFPPYLQHEVKSEERHRENMRLTFSFNLDINK
jgi:hypothetical protein